MTRFCSRWLTRSFGLLLALICGLAPAATINVPADYSTIQGAIGAASNGDVVVVAAGTYAEHVSFSGKAITVRSADPNSPSVVAATIIDAGRSGSGVSFSSGETASSVLSGFTITNGLSTGAGIGIYSSSPTIAHNVVDGNESYGDGGGLYVVGGSPVITANTFCNNAASAGAGMVLDQTTATVSGNSIWGNVATNDGGGILCREASPTLSGNTISDNTAGGDGGGIAVVNSSSSPTITGNCLDGNQAQYGGGISFRFNTGAVSNNVISGNTGSVAGGGIMSWDSTPSMINNTIHGNASDFGGGIYAGTSTTLSVVIQNCIITGSTSGGGLAVGYATISYCNIYGNLPSSYASPRPGGGKGSGNISAAPLFANALAGDFRLKSVAGRWNGSAWVNDNVTSPCVDTGDPASAFGNEPTPNGGRINMGYDGNTAYASRTPIPRVTTWSPKAHVGALNTVPFVATFNVAMFRASVESNFTVSPAKAGTFSWVGRKLTFTPTTPWMSGRWYTVTIARAARSATGVKMAAPFSWTFKTVASAAPAMLTVAAASTSSGVAVTTTLAVPAGVSASITNLAGRTVAALPERDLQAGTSTLLWSGQSTTGTKVPPGQYLICLTARTADGTQARMVATARLN